MCIFCKIIQGDLPSFKVYEDEYVLAFLDINPVTLGHTLVVPKHHVENIEHASEECLMHLAKTLPTIANQIKSTCQAKGFNYLSNSEKVSGQLVDHLHFHIIPRYSEQDNFKIEQETIHLDLNEVLDTILDK
ncbi:MAG: HIT family protein [Anaerorhabdus sp.]